MIAIDQDALGASASGTILVNNTNVMSAQVSVWHKPLADGTRAAALLNTGLFDASGYNLTLTSEVATPVPLYHAPHAPTPPSTPCRRRHPSQSLGVFFAASFQTNTFSCEVTAV